MPIPSDDEGLASNQNRSRADDAVQRRLPRTVYIVEIPLCNRIIHCDDRVTKFTRVPHGTKPVDPGCRFLGPSNHARRVCRHGAMNSNDEICTIVESQRRIGFNRSIDTPVEILHTLSMPCIDGVPLTGQPSGGIVLRRQRIAARPGNFGTRCFKCFNEHSGFFGHV